MTSTWEDLKNDSSEGEDDETEEVTNICFMANQEDEVSPCHMTYDELLNAFDNLLVDFQMMLSKYVVLKKQNELLANENSILKGKIAIFENKESTSLDLKAENDLLHEKVKSLMKDLGNFA